ncbi:vitelline membrane outer layer protein 1-like [Leptodactylus fuscus]|uniref:vitelline membrane outer layer protein 1-like n=1 Tax=Leptodactylus fuscus TaxID=238119 RepID=UPI003F4ED301
MFSSLAALLLIQTTLTYGYWIEVDNGGNWGDWGPKQRCPPNTSATGFSLKIEKPQGIGDDTAWNAIRLYCTNAKGEIVAIITSTEGRWGEWTVVSWCPRGRLLNYCLSVEPPQGDEDDTAANNIMMQCSDHTILTGNGGTWGQYGNWSPICSYGICGMQTRVEPPQGKGDDTSLNNVRFECCETQNLKL